MPKPKDRAAKRRTMRDLVKKHAKEARKGTRLLDLPADIEIWYPEEKCSMEMDILPYEVTSKHHPDGIEPGELWYRRPYWIHFIDRKPVVCPKSVGKRCPICEEVERLRKDYEANKELINGLKAREMCLFNYTDPTDKKTTVKIFDWSSFKFAQKLEQELDETDDMDDCAFAELDGGSTIRFRVSEDSFSGSKYFVTTRLDFRRPRRTYPESILEKVVNLDECFRVKSYEDLVALLTGAEDDDEDEEKPAKKAPAKKSVKPEPEEDDDEDDEPEEKPAKKAPAKKAAKPAPVEDEDDDWEDEDDDWEDEDDDEPEEKPAKKAPAKKSKVEPEEDEDDDEDLDDEDDDDWDDEDDEDEEPAPKSRKKKSEPEEDEEEEDFEDDEEDEDSFLTKDDVKEMSKEELLEVIDDNFSDQVDHSKTALKRMSLAELRKLVLGLI